MRGAPLLALLLISLVIGAFTIEKDEQVMKCECDL